MKKETRLRTAVDPPATLLSTIGNTPLLKLRRLAPRSSRVEIFAKAEFQNPGGSVKDRAAHAIVQDAERRGVLRAGSTILDATSGNTGIAYAMIAAARGYRLVLCVPENVTPERLRMLQVYGAEVVLTSAMDGTDGAIAEARSALFGRSRALLLRRPVQQRCQLARALRHDRTRDPRLRPRDA